MNSAEILVTVVLSVAVFSIIFAIVSTNLRKLLDDLDRAKETVKAQGQTIDSLNKELESSNAGTRKLNTTINRLEREIGQVEGRKNSRIEFLEGLLEDAKKARAAAPTRDKGDPL